MKRLVYVLLGTFVLFFQANAQLKMDCDGDVGIGSISGDPTYKLQVKGDIQFDVLSGCKFHFLLYGTSPLFRPSWSNSARIGLSNYKLYYLYSNNVWYNNLYDMSDISIKENIRSIEKRIL